MQEGLSLVIWNASGATRIILCIQFIVNIHCLYDFFTVELIFLEHKNAWKRENLCRPLHFIAL